MSHNPSRQIPGREYVDKGRSKDNRLDPVMRDYIVAIFKQWKRNFRKCEYKGCDIPKGKYEIHHTKYEGATIYDLQIVCRKCNAAYENRRLA